MDDRELEPAVRPAVDPVGMAVGGRSAATLAGVGRRRADAERQRDQGESPESEHLPQHPDHLLLEPHILESFCGAAIERCRRYWVITARSEIALRRPSLSCMTGRGELG